MSIFVKLTDLAEGHEATQDDFNRRFAETYLVLQEKERQAEIVYCDNTRGNTIRVYQNKVQLMELNGTKEDVLLTPFLPKVGYYNTQNGPIYLYKAPKKQYRRSFCNGIYVIAPPRCTADGIARVDWNMMAQACFKREYVHLDDITNKLFANIAISPEFVVTANNKGIATLLYKRYEIAQLDFNSRCVNIIQPKLQQEICDYFKYNGVQTWKLR